MDNLKKMRKDELDAKGWGLIVLEGFFCFVMMFVLFGGLYLAAILESGQL